MVIDGAIGELSMFHDTFGYYAQDVDERTATLPGRWNERLVPIRTKGVTGLCLEVHDLAVAKLVAGRPKDLEFVALAARHGLIQEDVVQLRLEETSLREDARSTVEARMRNAFLGPAA